MLGILLMAIKLSLHFQSSNTNGAHLFHCLMQRRQRHGALVVVEVLVSPDLASATEFNIDSTGCALDSSEGEPTALNLTKPTPETSCCNKLCNTTLAIALLAAASFPMLAASLNAGDSSFSSTQLQRLKAKIGLTFLPTPSAPTWQKRCVLIE